MELVLSIVIGLLTMCGVWLILRPRTYQVIIGLSLLSYAVNLFLFSSGRIAQNKPPLIVEGVAQNLERMSDPIPQALVLTAIVIGFATTALFLVMIMTARGFNGNDHVDGTDVDAVMAKKKQRKEAKQQARLDAKRRKEESKARHKETQR